MVIARHSLNALLLALLHREGHTALERGMPG
jgi:hypothetical protein